MDEPQETLLLLQQLRTIVVELSVYKPFNDRLSWCLDHLTEMVERLENKL